MFNFIIYETMCRDSEVLEKEIALKTQSIMDCVGKNLRKERLKQNISRVELAYLAKTTESVICNIENAKKTGISIYSLVKISEALDVKLSILFDT